MVFDRFLWLFMYYIKSQIAVMDVIFYLILQYLITLLIDMGLYG